MDTRHKELKAFDDTKTGVKGLVDTGIVSIPRIFVRPPEDLSEDLNNNRTTSLLSQLPIIDLNGIERADRRKEIVKELCDASEHWGFFQVVNHEIPLSLTEKMIAGVREFHEQESEVKKEYYSRDRANKKVVFSTSNDLYYARSAAWRDTLAISLRTSEHLDPNELPALMCRDTTLEFIEKARKLGKTIFGLLSEALGLEPGHLEALGCAKGCSILCHYYPACPQPDLALGSSRHADPSFLTLLLQHQIGGLQVLHQNQWVNVPPLYGAFVVNIGDFLQMLSNDKFKSVQHRVLANRIGPRISVTCFFNGSISKPEMIYRPIKELISDENPPLYKDFEVTQYVGTSRTNGGIADYFKL
ncbi:hypothetical protein LguiA_001207 [Lonicera macranthoides]